MDSEHTTRTYLHTHKCLPFAVPETFGHCTTFDGNGVGLPWTLMTKLQGQHLVDFFRDPSPEDESAVARQMAQLYLTLFHIRSPATGSLFIREETGEYYIGPPLSIGVAHNPAREPGPSVKRDETPWSGPLEYHTQWYTNILHTTLESRFGLRKWFDYARVWVLRSMVSAFLCIGEDQR